MSPALLRRTGLAGSVLLATAGHLGGALPGADLAADPVSIALGRYGPLILGFWLAGTGLQAYAWWAGRDSLPSARWVVVTAVLWLLPFLVVPPMGSRDFYSYACQGELFRHGISPYVHGVDALPCGWLETVSPIWRDTVTPYGPLFIMLAAAAVAVGGGLAGALVVFRLLALAGVVAVAVCLPVLARRCGVPPARALWVGLAGPLVGAHLLAAPHNDAVMLGLAVGGLTVVVRRPRSVVSLLASGALLGLAVAVKAIAVVVVPFAILIAGAAVRRASGGMPGGRTLLVYARTSAVISGSTVGALGVVTVVSGLGFGWVGAMRVGESLIQFTSPPTAVGMTLTYLGRTVVPGFDAVPAVRTVAMMLLAAVLVLLWVRALLDREPVRAALHGAALALAATVLLAPVFHPWYALWPLTLLAATTVHTRVVMLVNVAAAFSVLPDGSGLTRFVKFPGAPLVTVLLIWCGLRWWKAGPARRANARTAPADQAAPIPRPLITR